MLSAMNRRQNLAAGLVAFVAGTLRIGQNSARADAGAVDLLVAQFTHGRTPLNAKVNLDLPDTTPNGEVIPLEVTVESPMSASSHVEAVLLVTDSNASPRIAVFRFVPNSGAVDVRTRIRLKPSTTAYQVTAVAKMSDGSCFKAVRQITVTDSGCGS